VERTGRRRTRQQEYNAAHGITARSVIKSVEQVRFITRVADARSARVAEPAPRGGRGAVGSDTERSALIARLELEMQEAAAALDFETAARIRDHVFEIRAAAG